MVRTLWIALISLSLAPAAAGYGLNMDLLKRDTQVFEGIIASVLRQNFEFFEIDAEPKAAYLDGFGITVDFRLKINRSSIRSPFGERPQTGKTPGRTVRQHIQTVRAAMVRILADYGGSIKQLEPGQKIAITAHIEDRNVIDPVHASTVIVFSVNKEDVELFSQRKLALGGFSQRVSITEY